MFKKSILLIILNFVISQSISSGRFENYFNHSCIRDCTQDPEPRVCEYDWTLELYTTLSRACHHCPLNQTDCLRENCVPANGLNRPIETVNRMLPGPAIQVCLGDIVVVNLHNKLRSERVTSIHWHGVLQKNTPHMDGVGLVTQCPITPHSSFTYTFQANNSGTHVWHSHSGTQRADGVFGSFIVRESNDKHASLYDYDVKEHVIILNDWTRVPFQSQLANYLFSGGYGSVDAILINGKGQNSGQSGLFQPPLESFSVGKGRKYRFRLINVGLQNCPMQFSVDGHNLTMIATDGNPIEPVQVESFMSYPGERYDFVLDANAEPKDYWIKVRGDGDCFNKNIFQLGVLSYEQTNHSSTSLNISSVSYNDTYRSGKIFETVAPTINNDVITIDKIKHVANDENTKAYFKEIARKPDHKFYLTFDMRIINNPEFHNSILYPISNNEFDWYSPQVNNISMMMPPIPPLFNWDSFSKDQICNEFTRNRTCPEGPAEFCSCIHTIEVKLNDLVELVVVDEATMAESHPVHLHGHKFAVLGTQKIKNDLKMREVKEMDKAGLLNRDLNRPVLKDTLQVPTGGYSVIRFIADNPGFWLFHCHLEFHAESGMMVLFKVGDETDLPSKPKDWPTCGETTRPGLFKNEHKLKGVVNSLSKNHALSENSTLEIVIHDTSLADAPAVVLGREVMFNPKNFPVYFEVYFNSSSIIASPNGSYQVDVRITQNERLEFLNDQRVSLVNYNDGKLLNFVAVNVKHISYLK